MLHKMISTPQSPLWPPKQQEHQWSRYSRECPDNQLHHDGSVLLSSFRTCAQRYKTGTVRHGQHVQRCRVH